MGKILLVEDEKDVREGVKYLLEAHGYNIIEASNGREAIGIIKNELPDLILSDIMMPGINGYKLFSEIKQMPELMTVPFIFLTAKSDVSDIRYGMNCGVDDYIIKPFSSEELLDAVNIRLEKKKQIDACISRMSLELSHSIPHELRTPLVPILGYTDFLIEEYQTIDRESLNDILMHIKKSGKKLHWAIERFIIYIELSQLKNCYDNLLNTPSNEANKIIEKIVVEKATSHNRKEDISIQCLISEVKIYEGHLKLIATELIDNAFKFSPPGKKIMVSCFTDEEDFVFEVCDLGNGMSSDQINYFSAASGMGKRKYFGNGFGLLLVNSVLNLYGGKLDIKSEPGKFTRVVVSIPLKKNILPSVDLN